VSNRGSGEPPEILRLAGHPVRWRILCELARSDRSVRELSAALGEQQSLVSYHVGRLRASGLALPRRSSADGRDTYYALDLTRCGTLLAAAAESLHAGLLSGTPRPLPRAGSCSVLFLCTGNSARSQIAEALLTRQAGPWVTARSAGSHPKDLHRQAVRVMAERGIDISAWRSKSLLEFDGQPFDVVVTLCDKVKEVCPDYSPPTRRIHWSTPDPAAVSGGPRALERAFRDLADRLDQRIRHLIPMLQNLPLTSSRGVQ
jgi:protein-tyrosine-phosphatase/DNA-binding transcriptional ArsR family regulator